MFFFPDYSGVSALVSGVCVCFCLNVGVLTSVTVGFIEFIHLKSPSVTSPPSVSRVLHHVKLLEVFCMFLFFFSLLKVVSISEVIN